MKNARHDSGVEAAKTTCLVARLLVLKMFCGPAVTSTRPRGCNVRAIIPCAVLVQYHNP